MSINFMGRPPESLTQEPLVAKLLVGGLGVCMHGWMDVCLYVYEYVYVCVYVSVSVSVSMYV